MTDKNEQEDDLDVIVEGYAGAEEGSADATSVSPEDGMADLKRQLDDERARRAEAERQAHSAKLREHKANIDKRDADYQLVSNAAETLERDIEIMTSNQAEAMRRGDHLSAAKIQREVSEASAQVQQLKNGLRAMEEERRKPIAPPSPPPPSDPVEAFVSQLATEPSRKWVRDHPEYARDPRLTRKMIAAHELAVADGITPDTPQYFEAIEQTLRITPKAEPVEQPDASSVAAKVSQRRDAAPAAAPVSRGTPRNNVVRLSVEEREMAEMMGMTPQQYASNKVALQKEGKIK